MVLSMKKHWKKIAQYTVDVTFWLCMLATAWFATQVLLFASFKIPSDSMEPELTTGTGNGWQGVDMFALPSSRSVGLNLKLNF